MPAIQFKHSSPANEDAPKPPLEQMVPRQPEPLPFSLPQLRKNKYNIQIEWVRHSRFSCTIYLLVGIFLTSYYSACFITQYGTFDKVYEIKPTPILHESILTRVIMVEWLLLAVVLLFGMSIFRRIFMPLYIYLAVMATNGTLVLFVVKFKQFTEGKIAHDDLSLNLVGILLITASAHNLVYLYAMHLHLSARTRAYSRAHRAIPPVMAPVQNEEKKDLNGLA